MSLWREVGQRGRIPTVPPGRDDGVGPARSHTMAGEESYGSRKPQGRPLMNGSSDCLRPPGYRVQVSGVPGHLDGQVSRKRCPLNAMTDMEL